MDNVVVGGHIDDLQSVVKVKGDGLRVGGAPLFHLQGPVDGLSCEESWKAEEDGEHFDCEAVRCKTSLYTGALIVTRKLSIHVNTQISLFFESPQEKSILLEIACLAVCVQCLLHTKSNCRVGTMQPWKIK